MRRLPTARDEMFPSLRGQGMIVVDLETKDEELRERGAGYHRADTFIAGVAVGTEAGFRRYYPIAHEPGGNLDRAKVLPWLREQMAIDVPKVGSRLSYDLGFLHAAGVEPVGPFYDTEVAEPILDENRFRYGIDYLGQDYLGEGKDDERLKSLLTERYGRKNPMRYIWRAHPDEVGPYAVRDVDLSLRVFLKQKVRLEAEGLWPIFSLETRLIPMLVAMRLRGVGIDVPRVEAMEVELSARLEALNRQIRHVAGVDVEVWAAASVARALQAVDVSDYPRTPKTKAPSFTAEWLEACPHPLASLVLEARRVDKLLGTFVRGQILENLHQGRVHCQFNQLRGEGRGAVSGRFSCEMPNLQFVPMRTEEGRKIREAFVPEPGNRWGKADFSQIELRFAVHDGVKMKFRGAAELAQRYHRDPSTDPYQEFADQVGITRKKAKTIVLAILYGEGVPKMSRQLGLSLEDGEDLARRFDRGVPFFRQLTKAATALAQNTGVVTTILGRKRRFETWVVRRRVAGKLQDVFLRHRVPGARRAFTHAAFNARDQGSAADIMKKAMVDVWDSGVCSVLGPPLITVHDELDHDVPDTEVGMEAFRESVRIMENCVRLTVPLRVDAEVGTSWGALEEVEV